MELLVDLRVKIALLLVAPALLCAQASAIDFEKKLKYDRACRVLAVSSSGDVYLQCKDTEGILKTTVDLPTVATMATAQSIRENLENQKKVARAQLVWDMLQFAFRTQLHLLLTFNESKTLITDAVMYMQPELEERLKAQSKINL